LEYEDRFINIGSQDIWLLDFYLSIL
jgi:hypothetical protein